MPLRFLSPNYHVVLIHYPLGVFVLGVILEFFSFLWRRSSARVAARWMILLGALLSIPAATSGIAALLDVKSQGAYSMDRYSLMRLHVLLMSAGTVLAVFFAVFSLGASDRWRDRLRWPLLIGFILTWGVMTSGAWYGGETIYQQGTSVGLIKFRGKDEPKPFLRPAVAPEAANPGETLTEEQRKAQQYQRFAHFYVGGERQVHIVFSGFALAVAMAALGLSIRRLTTLRAREAEEMDVEAQEMALVGGPPRRVTDDVSMMRTLNPDAEVESMEKRVPVSRFWIAATVLTVVTAAMGYWILEKHLFATAEGWHKFLPVIRKDNLRHFAHFILTGALVAFMLVMAVLALWAPRRALLLTVFSSLLVLTIAFQIWIGVLLTFDDEGPLLRFNPPDTDSSAMTDAPAAQVG